MKTVLRSRAKEKFDLSNSKHIEAAREFFLNSSWGKDGCPFIEEFPYQSVPDMIKTMIVLKFLKISIEQDRETRIY